MAEKILLTIRVHGERQIEVDRAEYEQAKEHGSVDHFLDADLSDLDTDSTVIEPDGRSYDPHEEPYGPDDGGLEDAAAAEETGTDDEQLVDPPSAAADATTRALNDTRTGGWRDEATGLISGGLVTDDDTPHGLDPGQVC